MAGPKFEQPECGPKGGARGPEFDDGPFFWLAMKPMFEAHTPSAGSFRDDDNRFLGRSRGNRISVAGPVGTKLSLRCRLWGAIAWDAPRPHIGTMLAKVLPIFGHIDHVLAQFVGMPFCAGQPRITSFSRAGGARRNPTRFIDFTRFSSFGILGPEACFPTLPPGPVPARYGNGIGALSGIVRRTRTVHGSGVACSRRNVGIVHLDEMLLSPVLGDAWAQLWCVKVVFVSPQLHLGVG